MEEIPASGFPFPARWLRVGDLQLHLFESEDSAPQRHHFGLDVNDFEATYEKVKELGAWEKEGYFSKLYELSGGTVQMYIRGPARNIVEANWPEVPMLGHPVVTENFEKVKAKTDQKPTLYLRPRSASGFQATWPATKDAPNRCR